MQTHIGCVRSHFERERRTVRLVGSALVPAGAATGRASRITHHEPPCMTHVAAVRRGMRGPLD
ncbi:hypothetical protein QZM38_02155 [Burkholderia orbicola]|nr:MULTISPECIES: hypothetical protein [Burkholderia cepacia complex]MDN7479598.1 hypothetical protein [Burkholderia orbicola]MDN7521506.1 hypothetical protein [Burkholderia orbicola]